jgi:hypothetical protein
MRQLVRGDIEEAVNWAENEALSLSTDEIPDAAGMNQHLSLLSWILLGGGRTETLRKMGIRFAWWRSGTSPLTNPDNPTLVHFRILMELTEGNRQGALETLQLYQESADPPVGTDADIMRPGLEFLAGDLAEIEFHKAWAWGAAGLPYEDGGWSWPFWLGLRAELQGESRDAVRHYRQAFNQLTWRVLPWHIVRAALVRLGEKVD